MQRKNISSGGPWEAQVGYSRAVRVGNHVFVAGTTATNEIGETVFPGDAYRQTRFILDKITAAIEAAGGGVSDVVHTRMFVTDISRWEEIGKAHGEVFGEIRPASTMVEVQRLINPDHLVEIEATCILGTDADECQLG
jgi:enamine deaminase RidA (YjgF/YER057c/UK114 family)